MTLIAIYNICARDDNAKIYMFKGVTPPKFELKTPIRYIHCPEWMFKKLLGRDMKGLRWVAFKDRLKTVIPGYSNRPDNVAVSLKMLKSIDFLIDISGYGFGSKWSDEHNRNWLDWLAVAGRYAKKKYLMPQSFGPLDFQNDDISEYAKKVFGGFDLIYAREDSSASYLSKLGINSVRMADSVLIEHDYDPSAVIKDFEKYKEDTEVKNRHNIAIIPNMRLIDTGGQSQSDLLEFYYAVIDRHMDKHDIYLTAHSGEDLELCRKIKEHYEEDERVIIIDHVLYSFNYESFVSKMDFIIASRYHSIIHAYKESVPAIILGWSDKYRSLAEAAKQTQYIIDPGNGNIENALLAVSGMSEKYPEERNTIRKNVSELQKQSCYAFLEGDS